MLSPKMQRTVRVNDSQLVMLSEKACDDQTLAGYLHKRTADSARWQSRWFVLYQNLLFYYENENCSRPSGVILLEGCYCDRLIIAKGKEPDPEQCFAISYRRENQRQYELKAANKADCITWIEAIEKASFNKLQLQKVELEQRHLHLLKVVESENAAKWYYAQQCEEKTSEIKKLRAELCALKKELRPSATQPHLARPGFQRAMSHGTASFYGIGSQFDSGGYAGGVQGLGGLCDIAEGSIEIQKIKKVQSFFRGWLCRRRWKQIVEQYIKSPHAENMRKRNSFVFQLLEAEQEYLEQLEVLVSCFLRPFKMAASSKKPPCSHEDVNSIFLNSETVLFLHQIFLKGLSSRMENWPTLVLGDLFDILLPMLSIYQEYVRNHHYSLQVLTECKQSSPAFVSLLTKLEKKPACGGHSLEDFLKYPMEQVPRYIIALHNLLSHTPYDHVERISLQNAKQQLEDLSRQMRDQVSETENLRMNLGIERMIVEGCDILLDVNQVFVRQGELIQIIDKAKGARSRLSATFGGKSGGEKEAVKRQCLLFSNHLILTTRQANDESRLNLVPQFGKIQLSDAILIEDPNDQAVTDDDVCSMSSGISESSGSGSGSTSSQLQNRDFKIIFDVKSGGPQLSVHLVAYTTQEKAAWISDISQCMDNVYFTDLLQGSLPDTGSVTMPQSVRNDPKLFKDDDDIKFYKTSNSCKIPQIRSATPERLLQRLTDLRFLSIDFLNTFLLTYRVFTDGVTVLQALKKVFYEAEPPDVQMPSGSLVSLDALAGNSTMPEPHVDDRRRSSVSPRRTSGASSVSGYGSEISECRDPKNHSCCDTGGNTYTLNSKGYFRSGYKRVEEEQPLGLISEAPPIIKRSPTVQSSTPSGSLSPATPRKISIRVDKDVESDNCHLTIPKVIAVSSSSETLTDNTVLSAPSSPSNLSTVTLVGSTGSGSGSGSDRSPQDGNVYSRGVSEETDTPVATETTNDDVQFTYDDPATEKRKPSVVETAMEKPETPKVKSTDAKQEKQASANNEAVTSAPAKVAEVVQPQKEQQKQESQKQPRPQAQVEPQTAPPPSSPQQKQQQQPQTAPPPSPPKQQQQQQQEQPQQRQHVPHYCDHRASIASAPAGTMRSGSIPTITGNYRANRMSIQEEMYSCTQPASFQHDQASRKAGVVVTSSRQSQRSLGPDNVWSSTSTAATAFAIATSASSNPPDKCIDGNNRTDSCRDRNRRKESVMSTAATMRVLNVLRHWISKHMQDFELDPKLKTSTIEFLEEIMYCPNLLPAEHKVASQLLRLITKEEPESNKVDLQKLLAPPTVPSKESIETLSALEIAEQLTYLDHKIFMSITSEELLGQAWMKNDKSTRAPHILLMTKRFNEVSQLVVSEIIRRNNISARVAAIEKWTAVADISRVLHNYNGVLQIYSAFTNTSVYRLKKTWEKVSKTTKQTIDRLRNIVSSDSNFKNLKDVLHRCDPPCIPYLGLYLTNLSFIEEATPNFTEEGLLIFSKMRLIANVIREIRRFQQIPYKIELITRVTNYLLDPSLLLSDEELYRMSLVIEPKTSRISSSASVNPPSSTSNSSTK